MTFRIHELQSECRRRNISLDNNIKYTSQDYIQLLGEYSLVNMYGSLDNVPFPILYRFNLLSLMLSKSFKDISLELQNEILKNKNEKWIGEYKYRGCRSLIIYYPETGFHFFSRELSLDTFLPIEFTNKILFIKNGKLSKPSYFANKFPKPFVLDSEIMMPDYVDTTNFNTGFPVKYYSPESNPVSILLSIEDDFVCHDLQKTSVPLFFIIFDILYYDVDIKDKPLKNRKQLQEQLISKLIKYDLPFENSVVFKTDFMDIFNTYLNEGGEGIIFKNLDKGYLSTLSRHSNVQVKLKKHMLTSIKEQKDFDVFISGFIPPKSSSKKDKDLNRTISGIKCSIFIKKPNGDEIEHEICSISSIPESLLSYFTTYDEKGKFQFNTDVLGKVLSVTGQGLTSTLKFEYSYCDNWDFYKDKNKYDCVVLEEDLMKLIY